MYRSVFRVKAWPGSPRKSQEVLGSHRKSWDLPGPKFPCRILVKSVLEIKTILEILGHPSNYFLGIHREISRIFSPLAFLIQRRKERGLAARSDWGPLQARCLAGLLCRFSSHNWRLAACSSWSALSEAQTASAPLLSPMRKSAFCSFLEKAFVRFALARFKLFPVLLRNRPPWEVAAIQSLEFRGFPRISKIVVDF